MIADTVYVLDEYGLPTPKKEEPPMPPAPKTSKPKTSKPAARKALPRWTDSEVEMLMTAIKNSKSNLEAFRQIAEETGRSVGTVQQKYYGLKKKNTAAGRVMPNRAGKRSQEPTGSANDVSGMDTDSLVALVTEAHAELRRRQEQLSKAMERIGS